VLLKIAPDSPQRLDDVVHIARSRRVDGMIVANTSWRALRPSRIERAKEAAACPAAAAPAVDPDGARLCRAEGAFPLIGVGGIDSVVRR